MMEHSARAEAISFDSLPQGSPVRIRADLASFAEFGSVGPTAVTRLAFTEVDEAAHHHAQALMRAEGLEVSLDAFGNVFGCRRGTDATALPVMTGSHLDGPPGGGLYDGTAGVACALEAVRLLNEAGLETRRSIEVAAVRCEHLDRFGLSCLGSRAMAGKLTPEDLDRLRDAAGVTLRRALTDAGYRPDELTSVRRAGRVDAFLELHIEQGRVLEDAGKRLGLVTGIAGPTRFHVTLAGMADHSGGTPMNLRRDALAGAAEIVLALERGAQETEDCVGTVGILHVHPGAAHTIPGEARLHVDIRGVRAVPKRRLVQWFREAAEEIARRRKLWITMTPSVDEDPVPTSPRVLAALRFVLERLGYEFLEMPSGGGHDAQHMAACTDAGMIFVPSVRGISHTPEEYTSPDDLALGATALAAGLLTLAEPGGRRPVATSAR